MKKRSLGKMFLLTIVTLGIYRLYWFVKTRRELMSTTDVKIPSPWILLAPIALIVIIVITMLSSLFSTYGSISKYDDCMEQKGYVKSDYYGYSLSDTPTYKADYEYCLKATGVSSPMNPVFMVLIYVTALGYLPLTAWWLWNYCKGVEKVTGEKLSFALALIVLLVIPDGIDILIVQDYFNKIPTHTPHPHTGPAPAA